MGKRWTKEEVSVLRKNYPEGGLKVCKKLLGNRTDNAIHLKVNKLAFHRIYGFSNCSKEDFYEWVAED